MINCTNVSFGYGKVNDKSFVELIHSVSLQIDNGDFVAITGENGAGKSTFSKLLAGLVKPVTGKIVVNGMDTAITKNSVLASKIGFLFQNPDRQLCCYTIREEIAFGLKALKYGTEKEIYERADKIVKQFDFDGDEPPFALSRGQRQRLALASVIAVKPEIMILDEPTTGLDYTECMQIMNEVKILNQAGTTVIMVCHDMELVLDFAKRMIVFADGKIIADGPVQKIQQDMECLNKASLLPPQIIQVCLDLKNRMRNSHKEFVIQTTAASLAAEIKQIISEDRGK